MDSSSLATPSAAARLGQVYRALLGHHGPQHWWPAETPFEVMVGAVLTQNTTWVNVERAIRNLKTNPPLPPFFKGGLEAGAPQAPPFETRGSDPDGAQTPPFEKGGPGGIFSAEALLALPLERLAAALRPVGYFNVKARRLRGFCAWYLDRGGYEGLARLDTASLRRALLAVSGIGPETADDILLYAFGRPVFVIDAYTRRLFARLQLIAGDEDYEVLRALLESALVTDPELFKEYHALIVRHAKETCRKAPRCAECCLRRDCLSAPGR